jgi:hypothetical protein
MGEYTQLLDEQVLFILSHVPQKILNLVHQIEELMQPFIGLKGINV